MRKMEYDLTMYGSYDICVPEKSNAEFWHPTQTTLTISLDYIRNTTRVVNKQKSVVVTGTELANAKLTKEEIARRNKTKKYILESVTKRKKASDAPFVKDLSAILDGTDSHWKLNWLRIIGDMILIHFTNTSDPTNDGTIELCAGDNPPELRFKVEMTVPDHTGCTTFYVGFSEDKVPTVVELLPRNCRIMKFGNCFFAGSIRSDENQRQIVHVIDHSW